MEAVQAFNKNLISIIISVRSKKAHTKKNTRFSRVIDEWIYNRLLNKRDNKCKTPYCSLSFLHAGRINFKYQKAFL